MNTEFISYEMALELKELGFYEPCICGYNDYHLLRNKFSSSFDGDFVKWDVKYDKDLRAPLYQQAFRFFREKYNLFSCVQLHLNFPTRYYFIIDEIGNDDFVYHTEDETIFYDKYEDAEIACLKLLIEIVKNK